MCGVFRKKMLVTKYFPRFLTDATMAFWQRTAHCVFQRAT
ncbi:hypothetical protein ATPR_2600 [Acetobacter tropicalis NBRC 101654]|uniref:Uncharacterized protein n=1 Tax=Acetobacter tropicalis NBRC 101654 TaxID=749388 RepID=F7VGV1_9PROT|nr:hypothetical protein ATPR_2600 [Acetobacter tropicalis NBRC 101654]